ncbi:MAG: UDP-N-acetylmuramoyl-L-alanyl-D-glutamate--2,6-diaminopimelate ligase, partial [Pseudomonadota bacterium]
MIALADIAQSLGVARPAADMPLFGVSADSRAIAPGFVFVAIPGTRADGMDYAAAAIAKGATLIVGERAPQDSL